ncbi:MAG: hypothetical protein ACREBR_00095 [bacterium]
MAEFQERLAVLEDRAAERRARLAERKKNSSNKLAMNSTNFAIGSGRCNLGEGGNRNAEPNQEESPLRSYTCSESEEVIPETQDQETQYNPV